MTEFLALIQAVITALVGNFGTILTLYTTQPILTVTFAIFVFGAVIGLVGRVIHI